METRIERIGFWPRVGAALIDAILASVVAFIGVVLYMGGTETVFDLWRDIMEDPTRDWEYELMDFTIGATLGGLLYSMIEALTGASPGKRMLGFQIGNQNGTEADTPVFLKRWAAKNSNTLFTILSIITGATVFESVGTFAGFLIFVGCFFVLGTDRQSFHDMFARTAVYRKSDLAEGQGERAEGVLDAHVN